MELIKNKDYIIKINDINESGEGIGKIDNFIVFVKGALPEEEVLIKLIKIKKSYGYGKLLKIIKKSENRIEPICEVFKKCGGCNLQHLKYCAQVDFKTKIVKDNLERIGGFSDIKVLDTISSESPFRYRNKAQFPVGFSEFGPLIGFYAPRSHNIIDIRDCCIQNKINEKIIGIIKSFIIKNNISIYDEKTHKGIFRHIVTRTGFVSKEIMVCIVINGDKLPKDDLLINMLLQEINISTIVLNHNTQKTNVILGEKTSVLYGRGFIEDYIGEFKFEISPVSFFQVNPIQTEKLYKTALDFADFSGNETVIDAYCGIGTISLFISKKVKKVIGVEIVSDAVSDAKRNSELNNVNNVEFIVGKAEEVIPELYKKRGVRADVLFLDPPRKGCDIGLINMILEADFSKIIYISCNPSTLARDLKRLSDKYRVDRVQPVDMFCMSTHVECVVLMSKVQN